MVSVLYIKIVWANILSHKMLDDLCWTNTLKSLVWISLQGLYHLISNYKYKPWYYVNIWNYICFLSLVTALYIMYSFTIFSKMTFYWSVATGVKVFTTRPSINKCDLQYFLNEWKWEEKSIGCHQTLMIRCGLICIDKENHFRHSIHFDMIYKDLSMWL